MGRTQRGVKGIVIQAAKSIFARYGFKKTTMDEIAKATHLAKSSIYHYFRSKEEIFEAILEQEMQTLMADVRQAVMAENSPPEKLRAFFRSRLHAIQNATNFYSVFIDEYFEHYTYIEGLRKSFDAQEMKFVAGILEDGINAGVFAIDKIEAIIVAIRAALRGIEYYYIVVEKNFNKIKKVQDLILKTLLYGIMIR